MRAALRGISRVRIPIVHNEIMKTPAIRTA
jgi:hypothetical protein